MPTLTVYKDGHNVKAVFKLLASCMLSKLHRVHGSANRASSAAAEAGT